MEKRRLESTASPVRKWCAHRCAGDNKEPRQSHCPLNQPQGWPWTRLASGAEAWGWTASQTALVPVRNYDIHSQIGSCQFPGVLLPAIFPSLVPDVHDHKQSCQPQLTPNLAPTTTPVTWTSTTRHQRRIHVYRRLKTRHLCCGCCLGRLCSPTAPWPAVASLLWGYRHICFSSLPSSPPLPNLYFFVQRSSRYCAVFCISARVFLCTVGVEP